MEPNHGGAGILGAAPAASRSRLNPDAPAYNPRINRALEGDRCCFLTFSNGYPMVEAQIIQFFNENFGANCVERVYMHRPVGQVEPQFGKVVFRSVLTSALVLQGREVKKYMVDGCPMWCKNYDQERAGQQQRRDLFQS